MGKERRAKIPRPAPYQTGSSSSSNPIRSPQTRPELIISQKEKNEWDEARCPVCMDHPHNAVLLQCDSKHNGCKPFMCNTSYRHSNCLDQFNKSHNNNSNTNNNNSTKSCCPLCRGSVTGWIVEQPARNYMNSKSRSCSSESCEFNGTYEELRRHAREAHPDARPSEADPDRLRDWRRMENERDLGDLFSVLAEEDGGDLFGGERERYFAFPNIAIFLIVHVLGEGERNNSSSGNGNSNNMRGIRGISSSRGPRRRRRVLWGESVSEFNDEFGYGNGNDGENGEEGEEEGENERRESGERRSRRFTMNRDDESEL
ncbi:hypothetical protein LUZ60_000607 [Juncus effusus]|nr:hypothetical protein LUZ60_000607 [Juncus effusus]